MKNNLLINSLVASVITSISLMEFFYRNLLMSIAEKAGGYYYYSSNLSNTAEIPK